MAWIAGERVILRAWERDDVRARWEADQTTDASEARLRDWHEPPRSLHDRERDFEADHEEKDPSVVALIIEAEERAVGDINFFHIDTRNRGAKVGLSIWRPDDRDKGYGGDALRALLRWGFRELNLHRVELEVDTDNARAIHIYERLGFVREGTLRERFFEDGCYRDELVMALLRREFEAREARAAAP